MNTLHASVSLHLSKEVIKIKSTYLYGCYYGTTAGIVQKME
jgi:hypothetical protein